MFAQFIRTASPLALFGIFGTTGVKASGDDEFEIAMVLVFIFIYLVASLIQFIMPKINKYILRNVLAIPVSVAWFGSGVFLGFLGRQYDMGLLGDGLKFLLYCPSEIIYFVLLPILLFESAISCSWHQFRRLLLPSLFLAVIGVAFTTIILSVLFWASFPVLREAGSHWSESLLVGASLASTDPVAVISVLKSLNCPAKLMTLFEGESLINDGTSVAFFQLFLTVAAGSTFRGAGEIAWVATKLLCLSPIYGYLCGLITVKAVELMDIPWRETRFLVVFVSAMAYLVFLTGDHYLGLSGPLATVVYGLFFSAGAAINLGSKFEENNHHFVETLSSLGESAIFIIAGIVSFRSLTDSAPDPWAVPVAYLYLNVARGILFFLAYFVIRKSYYGVSVKETAILVYGGLRGAIVVALLIIIQDTAGIRPHYGAFAGMLLGGCVILILVINGSTFEIFYNLINPYKPTSFRKVGLSKTLVALDNHYEQNGYKYVGQNWVFQEAAGPPNYQNPTIVERADSIVPKLGWRTLNDQGKLPTNILSVRNCFKNIEETTAPYIAEFYDSDDSSDSDIQSQSDRTFPKWNDQSLHQQVRRRLQQQSAPDLTQSLKFHRRSTANLLPSLQDLAKDESNDPFEEPNLDDSSLSLNKEDTHEFKSSGRRLSHRDTLMQCLQVESSEKTSAKNEAVNTISLGNLARERISQIYQMTFTSIKQIYHELYHERLISPEAYASLEWSIDMSLDFSFQINDSDDGHKKFSNFVEFGTEGEGEEFVTTFQLKNSKNCKYAKSACPGENYHGGFQMEWLFVIHTFLNRRRHPIRDRLPDALTHGRRFSNSVQATDIIWAYVEAHEEMIAKGGIVLETQLSGHQMHSLRMQVEIAKHFACTELRAQHGILVDWALVRKACIMLLSKRKELIKEFSSLGVLLSEDAEVLLSIYELQQEELLTYGYGIFTKVGC